MSVDENENKEVYIKRSLPNERSRISHAVAILSGKGGVGKSFTTSYLAVLLKRKGYKVAILDGDITGPSIPQAFNVKGPIYGKGTTFEPAISKTGIQIMSSNLLLDNSDDPIVWRGQLISQMIEQFYTDVVYDCDYLLIDMAPGTSDVALTIFQKIKLSSAIIVTTPQDLVSHIVLKSIKMADLLQVPLLSLVCNMAYVKCLNCGEEIQLFGKTSDKLCKDNHIPYFDKVPFDSNIAAHMDKGSIEDLNTDYLSITRDAIINCSSIEDEIDKMDKDIRKR